MKFTTATVILSLFSSAIAVSIADLPACSLPCFEAAIASTTCSLTDVQCQCTTGKQAITDSVTPCLTKACSSSDLATTVTVSNEICAPYAAGASSSSSGSTAGTSTKASTSTGTATSAPAQVSSSAASIKNKIEMIGAGVCLVAAGMFAM